MSMNEFTYYICIVIIINIIQQFYNTEYFIKREQGWIIKHKMTKHSDLLSHNVTVKSL